MEEKSKMEEIKEFIEKWTRRQIQFDFSIQANFSILENIKNSKFCDDFLEWIEEENNKRNLPKIKGAEEIKGNRGTILQTTETTAIYVIPLQFIYVKEA